MNQNGKASHGRSEPPAEVAVAWLQESKNVAGYLISAAWSLESAIRKVSSPQLRYASSSWICAFQYSSSWGLWREESGKFAPTVYATGLESARVLALVKWRTSPLRCARSALRTRLPSVKRARSSFPNGKHTRAGAPAQNHLPNGTHACQLVSTPVQMRPLSAAHTPPLSIVHTLGKI